jgi:hypothetical protein
MSWRLSIWVCTMGLSMPTLSAADLLDCFRIAENSGSHPFMDPAALFVTNPLGSSKLKWDERFGLFSLVNNQTKAQATYPTEFRRTRPDNEQR